MKALAAFVLIAGGLEGQSVPARPPAGASVEICGRVTGFMTGTPTRCDASLEVTTDGGAATTIVIPASVRRGASGGRELEGAAACFNGTVELTEGTVTVRIPSYDAIRVTKPATSPPFGAGAADECIVEGVTMPRLLRDAKPAYTSDAMKAGVQGRISLDAVVSIDGEVTEARVAQSLHPDLDEEAIRALRTWRFAPAVLAGRPVPAIVNVEMTFSLQPRR